MADIVNRYQRIIEHIFMVNYTDGVREVPFQRSDLNAAAQKLGIELPKNLGDVIYSFRFRVPMPQSIQETAPTGECWVIELAGHGLYLFSLKSESASDIVPNPRLAETKVPDATPGLVSMYALSDEQALLAKMRYNRLVDLFTRLNCYSLQNHLRTTMPNRSQVETDEIYVGVNRQGVHFAIPVQAKGGRDRISIVQIEQDIKVCAKKFPGLFCRPLAAQFMANDVIALFEFEKQGESMVVLAEKHYRLVPPDSISETDLLTYQRRSDEE
jgi:hypothetical protein